MSAKCYSVEDFLKCKDARSGNENIPESKGDNMEKNLNTLLEYKNLATLTEKKCIKLRNELERVKQLYNTQKTSQSSNSNNQVDTNDENENTNLPLKHIRQNSNAIRTDTSGSAVTTINNILDGLTESIHTPELNSLATKKEIKNPNQAVQNIKVQSRGFEPKVVPSDEKDIKQKLEDIVSRYTCTLKSGKTMKRDKKIKKNCSKLNIIDKSFLPVDKVCKKVTRVTKPWSKMSITKRNDFTNVECVKPVGDFVEIYHNVAAKGSNSSENNDGLKLHKPKRAQSFNMIPPLNFKDQSEFSRNRDTYLISRRALSANAKNYESPTISSKLKEVTKHYLHTFDMKAIPFCPTTSTSPSHNIGINIQQVMNMLRNKQQVKEIPTTLAHNIGLAAEKWQSRTLPFLASAMTSRTCSRCPLLRSTMNFKQMQEMAKTIPEEPFIEDDENDLLDSPAMQSVIVTGPSGDVKIKNPKKSVWTADPKSHVRCTCCPDEGSSFQQIFNKYGSKSKTATQLNMLKSPPKFKISQSKSKIEGLVKKLPELPTQNDEKKLKEVLSKLHDEFESMQKKYDELSKKSKDNKANGQLTKILEELDNDLNNKEEEIGMVVNLYEEIIALKSQVQTLKQKASRDSIYKKGQQPSLKSIPNNASIAAKHLTKLLQQVQYYQNHYKRN